MFLCKISFEGIFFSWSVVARYILLSIIFHCTVLHTYVFWKTLLLLDCFVVIEYAVFI